MDYEKIIKNGERVEWYGEQVPQELLTNSVIFWCEHDLTDYRFCDIINRHFEQISRPIEEGRFNRSNIS